MKNPNTTKRNAVSAVEVMVSLVVVAVALVPALGSSIHAGRQTGFTRAHALAHVRATSRLEAVAARGYRELARAAARGESLAGPAPAGSEPFEVGTESIEFRALDERLGVLTVKLAWHQPGEPAVHRVTAFRFLSPADASWIIANPLPLPEPETTPAD